MNRENRHDQNAMPFRRFAKGFWAGRHSVAAFGCMALLIVLLLAACTTPVHEYEADTTPDHNGEAWLGGE